MDLSEKGTAALIATLEFQRNRAMADHATAEAQMAMMAADLAALREENAKLKEQISKPVPDAV